MLSVVFEIWSSYRDDNVGKYMDRAWFTMDFNEAVKFHNGEQDDAAVVESWLYLHKITKNSTPAQFLNRTIGSWCADTITLDKYIK